MRGGFPYQLLLTVMSFESLWTVQINYILYSQTHVLEFRHGAWQHYVTLYLIDKTLHKNNFDSFSSLKNALGGSGPQTFLPATQQAKGALGLVDHGAANPFGATQRPGPKQKYAMVKFDGNVVSSSHAMGTLTMVNPHEMDWYGLMD